MEFSQPRPAIAIMGFFFFGCDVLVLMAIEGIFFSWGFEERAKKKESEGAIFPKKLEIDKGKGKGRLLICCWLGQRPT